MSAWLSQVFSNLFKSVETFTAETVQEQIKAFQEFVNGGKNPVVRFWVEAGEGFGQQSSTANLIYRLAKPIDEKGLYFGYAGTIQIYYKNADELAKLKDLIPELALEDPKIDEATLEAIEFSTTPSDTVDLGFTGAADLVEDYAKKLNVNYFLRLQPFKSAAPEQIQRLDDKTIDPSKVGELAPGFANRLFHMDPSEYA